MKDEFGMCPSLAGKFEESINDTRAGQSLGTCFAKNQ